MSLEVTIYSNNILLMKYDDKNTLILIKVNLINIHVFIGLFSEIFYSMFLIQTIANNLPWILVSANHVDRITSHLFYTHLRFHVD